MFFILNNSKSGMVAQQQKLDIISNNMVNVNTTGYKKIDSSFSNLFYRDINSKSMPTTPGQNAILGSGVKTNSAVRSTIQGSLQSTGLSTDIAIDGEGFLKITDGNGGVSYTRSGALNLDLLGRLTDKDGNLIEVTYDEGVDPQNTGLTASNLVIDKYGYVSTSDGRGIGKINLYNTIGDSKLISAGNNNFVPADDDVVMFPVIADIHQGHLEMSNVDVAQEMSEMILAQRAYQIASKGITTADEMWSMLNKVR